MVVELALGAGFEAAVVEVEVEDDVVPLLQADNTTVVATTKISKNRFFMRVLE